MRILLVEDEAKMADFIQRGLVEAGHTVDSTDNGAQAESLAHSAKYDLMILDVMLPGQSGLDTARNLRRDGFKTPILMLTGLSGTKDKVNGLDSGADDYMTKPFAFEELLARIRALFRRQTPETPTVLKCGAIEMDLLARKVRRGEKSITLTQKEFALLEFFLQNLNRPVSRAEISQKVWDVQLDNESNVIDVYVNMLRKKLDDGSKKRLIQTVIGVGYVLKDE